MDRRQFLKTTAAGLLAATCTPSLLNAQKNKVKPNIVLIMADDISAKEFPTYRTPNPTYGDGPCSTPVLEKAKDKKSVLFLVNRGGRTIFIAVKR